MPRGTARYYFGRFNVIYAEQISKKDFVLRGLKSDVTIKNRNYIWGFFKVNDDTVEGENYASGYLVKYKSLMDEEIVDEKHHSLEIEFAENRVIAKCDFILHIKSGLIAYRPISNKVSPEGFRERFAQVFEQAHSNFLVSAEIQTIQDKFEFFEAINRLSYIGKIKIQLHPSNPDLKDMWKDVDEDIKKVKADNFYAEYTTKNKDESMEIPKDSNAFKGIAMASDGYGKADLTGLDEDGIQRKISTSETPIQVDAPPVEQFQAAIRIVSQIFKKLRRNIE